MKRIGWAAAFVTLGLAGGLLAGCGGSDSSSDAQTGPGDVAGASEGEIVKGGSAVIAEPWPILLGGFVPDAGWNFADWNVTRDVMEGLVSVSADGVSVEPGLAESWAFDESGRNLTFTLRDNAKFSDGKPVTSSDVKFSVEQWQAGPAQGWMLSAIDRVTTPDPLTVVMHLSSANTYLPTQLSFGPYAVMPAKFGGRSQEEFANAPVGAGPWQVKSFSRGKKIELERNPHYYNPDKPHLDEVTYLSVADPNQRLLQFQSGEVDIVYPPVPTDMVGQVEEGDLFRADSNYVTSMMFNTERAPMSDVNFRRAMSLALDRTALAGSLYDGVGAQPAPSALPTNVPGWQKPDGDWARFDLDEAKRLLAASGYNGETVKLLVDQSEGNQLVLAEAMQQQFRELGVNVAVERYDTASLFEQAGSGKADIAFHNICSCEGPSAIQGLERAIALDWNFTHFDATFAKEQLAVALAAKTDAERDAAIKKVEDWAFENVAWAPVVNYGNVMFVNRDLHAVTNVLGYVPTVEIARKEK